MRLGPSAAVKTMGLFSRAKALRKRQTDIVDFTCFEKRLVVEVDGGQHDERSAFDADRDARLESPGYRVLRFWNIRFGPLSIGLLDDHARCVLHTPTKVLPMSPVAQERVRVRVFPPYWRLKPLRSSDATRCPSLSDSRLRSSSSASRRFDADGSSRSSCFSFEPT